MSNGPRRFSDDPSDNQSMSSSPAAPTPIPPGTASDPQTSQDLSLSTGYAGALSSPTLTQEPDLTHSHHSTGKIVGGVLGLLIFIAATAVVALWYFRRRRDKSHLLKFPSSPVRSVFNYDKLVNAANQRRGEGSYAYFPTTASEITTML